MQSFLEFLKILTTSVNGWLFLIFLTLLAISCPIAIYFGIVFIIDKIKEMKGSRLIEFSTFFINTIIYSLVVYLCFFKGSVNFNRCYDIISKSVHNFSNLEELFGSSETIFGTFVIISIPITIILTFVMKTIENIYKCSNDEKMWIGGIVISGFATVIMYLAISLDAYIQTTHLPKIHSFTIFIGFNYLLCSLFCFMPPSPKSEYISTDATGGCTGASVDSGDFYYPIDVSGM